MEADQKLCDAEIGASSVQGFSLVSFGLGFYFFRLTFALATTDAGEYVRTVGGVSGTAMGVSIVLIILVLIGNKI